MKSSMTLKVLAGAVALALGAGAAQAAVTVGTGTGGTIFLIDYDQTNNTQFIYDTGLSTTGFTGTSSIAPINLSADPNYEAFLAGRTSSSDTLVYSLVGGSTGGSGVFASDFTATSAPGGTTAGIDVAQGNTQIANVLGQILNPAGGTSYQGTSAPPTTLWESGYEASFIGSMDINSDSATPGTALGFYQYSTTHGTSATKPAVLATFAGDWDFANGSLSYSAGAPVPLPTPVLLLLSGLGMMGLVTRRRPAAV